jgi:hypothetical protein
MPDACAMQSVFFAAAGSVAPVRRATGVNAGAAARQPDDGLTSGVNMSWLRRQTTRQKTLRPK